MEYVEFNKDLLMFLDLLLILWYVVVIMKSWFDVVGFVEFDECEDWLLLVGQGYYVIWNGFFFVVF